jgi:hypothetical protein
VAAGTCGAGSQRGVSHGGTMDGEPGKGGAHQKAAMHAVAVSIPSLPVADSSGGADQRQRGGV